MTKARIVFSIKQQGNFNELHTRGSREEIASLVLDALVHSPVAREILGEILNQVHTRAVGTASSPSSKTASKSSSRSNRKKK